jgi:hypothetical protein
MCRQSATVCLFKPPVLVGCPGLSLVERLVRLPDPVIGGVCVTLLWLCC